MVIKKFICDCCGKEFGAGDKIVITKYCEYGGQPNSTLDFVYEEILPERHFHYDCCENSKKS